jgi:hypothetical protein
MEKAGLIALGLYRLSRATDNFYAYVYTNPDPDCALTHKDRVFVLGFEINKDLCKKIDLNRF